MKEKHENELIELKVIQTNDQLLLLLESGNGYIGSVQSKIKQKIKIESFINEQHDIYCIGNNMSFSASKIIGFDAKDLNNEQYKL